MPLPFYGITIGTKGPSLNPKAIADMVDLTSGHPERIMLRFQVPMFLTLIGPNQFDYRLYDDAVSRCNDAGIPIYLTFKKHPQQGEPTIAEAVALSMAVAARYGNKIIAWECCNEDFGYDEFGKLAELMNAVYPKVKAINPDLLVYPAATLQRNTRNMQAAVATLLRKAGKSIDGLTIHTYFGIPSTGPHTPEDSSVPNVPSIRQYFQAVREVCVEEGYPDMDILDCEYGFSSTPQNHSNVPIFNEQDQWKHMKHCLDQARAEGVRHMSWFTLGYATPKPDGMSLVQEDGRKTIAYNGLKAYIEEFPTGGIIVDPDPGGDPDPDPLPDPTRPTPEQIALARAKMALARQLMSEADTLLSAQ